MMEQWSTAKLQRPKGPTANSTGGSERMKCETTGFKGDKDICYLRCHPKDCHHILISVP
jgi:hypothetical protein